MPFVLRDANGKINRASARPIIGAETLPYDNTELQSFLVEKGQDPNKVTEALSELRRTDGEMSRAVEDVVMALLKKNVLKMTDLPKPLQDRMSFRVKLRVMIQEIYDQASGTNNGSLPPSSSGHSSFGR